MSHALIIDDNVVLSRAIRNRLEDFGYDSFDYTWGEDQAVRAAARRRPDLIVVGDAIVEGSPLPVAGTLACSSHAPVLQVTRASFMLRREETSGAVVQGPFGLSQLDVALRAMQGAG
jgi:DNA-binding response OmpR family regulator